ncbi:MAG TPA: queuosine precursor transporter [Gammaproteobacteria bacterium]|nr:queuosine precursor transporter [Gammaproteobacteria bacterium]
MMHPVLLKKEVRAYLLLTSLVVCGMVCGMITAIKVVHFGIDFPYSVAVVAVLTYPIIDCICELWGKQAARQALWIGLFSQILISILIQISIYFPAAAFWTLQPAFHSVLSIGLSVVIASLAAFIVSQVIDIFVYQKIKDLSQGKWLWVRSNISVYLGQVIDSLIFVNILFYDSDHKLSILTGTITVKIILSFLMTPVVYLIVIAVNRYLDNNTFAFKSANQIQLIKA